jgi:hypothetical protein
LQSTFHTLANASGENGSFFEPFAQCLKFAKNEICDIGQERNKIPCLTIEIVGFTAFLFIINLYFYLFKNPFWNQLNYRHN